MILKYKVHTGEEYTIHFKLHTPGINHANSSRPLSVMLGAMKNIYKLK